VIRYALIALPGPGDAAIRMTESEGCPPSLLVAASRDDFRTSTIPRTSARDLELARVFREAGIEAVFVVGWEERIEPMAYEGCRYGGWNIHPSLLPAYRGHNPYFHVIRNGAVETGVTVHGLTSELDAGPILLQKRVAVRSSETLGSLWARLGQLGAETLVEALGIIDRGGYVLHAQPAGAFPVAPKVQPSDLVIESSMSVDETLRLVRAANPFYGAVFEWKRRGRGGDRGDHEGPGARMVKVFEAAPLRHGIAPPPETAAGSATSCRSRDDLTSMPPDAGRLGVLASAASESTSAAQIVDETCDATGPVIRLSDGYVVATVLEIEGIGIVSGRTAISWLKEE
jgi:methionyl-tRNA formyltransferase